MGFLCSKFPKNEHVFLFSSECGCFWNLVQKLDGMGWSGGEGLASGREDAETAVGKA